MGLTEKAYLPEIDYLIEEKKATQKHEYYKGEIFAMTGASIPHNRIVSNVLINAGNKIKKKGCMPFGSDLRVHIPSNSFYTYPDISIFCGEIEKADTDFDTAVNPIVIMEVLTKSTRDYDRGTKFSFYREINSLKEYIIIDSENINAEALLKNEDGTWLLRELKSDLDKLVVKSLDVEISLKEVYEGVF
jgi:Uma2 family endonuclease